MEQCWKYLKKFHSFYDSNNNNNIPQKIWKQLIWHKLCITFFIWKIHVFLIQSVINLADAEL